ncbi:RNA polymerase sigma factor [Membranihabitans maritimus]|uniref:RNA polymerase sigma factor n=1 Tax=Membranihabitans maritimus TaxID=2904244 RepID=UPI001F0029EC|nr:RNA polymerase sigma-70 factor [Membranihabitans maritimus]
MELEKIFDTYQNKVFGFFVKNLSDKELAKDLTQEVFFRLCKRESKLHEIEDINSYIFLMCRNMAINHINKASHDKKYKERLIYAWNHLSIRGKSQIEKNIDSEYYSEILKESLNHLPPQQKLIFTLSKQEGLSNKLIAKKLGLSPNTVRNHLHQALKSLRSTVNPNIEFIMLLLSISILI